MPPPALNLYEPIAKPADLSALLKAEIDEVRSVCESLPAGKTRLAEFLGCRIQEVSRYLSATNRQEPAGRFLAGMRAFVEAYRHQ